MAKASYVVILLQLTILIFAGCSGKEKRGKFTPEQVRSFDYSKTENLPKPSGAMAINVLGETITVKQLVKVLQSYLPESSGTDDFQVFRARTMPFAISYLREKITEILLYDQAKAKFSDDVDRMLDKAVETEVNRFVAEYGNNFAQAEVVIRDMGMDWKQFRQQQKRQMLTQIYMRDNLKNDEPITRTEIEEFYRANIEKFSKKASVEFDLIQIDPAALDSEILAELGETKSDTAAAKLASKLLFKLKGGADFADLARKYSSCPYAKKGGRWTPVNPASLAEPYDFVAEKALGLEPGRISEVIHSGGQYFIIRLVQNSKASVLPISQVQDSIEMQLRILNQNKAFTELTSKLTSNYDSRQLEEFVEYCIERAYQKRLYTDLN